LRSGPCGRRRPDSTAGAVAAAAAAAPDKPWIEWHTKDFFSTCDGNCGFAVFGGREIKEAMEEIFITNPSPPWKWVYSDGGIVAANFSRRLVSFWDGALQIEPEVGVGQRFGNMHAEEFWFAINYRWTAFPWNDYLVTTIDLADGPSLATKIEAAERERTPGHKGDILLNYFSPEVTFALPDYPNEKLMFRYHHRSGMWGTFNGVYGGAQFATVGFRQRF
jgi:hypothetical protein